MQLCIGISTLYLLFKALMMTLLINMKLMLIARKYANIHLDVKKL